MSDSNGTITVKTAGNPFTINKLTIELGDGKQYDVLKRLMALDLYESMFTFFMTGQMLIYDTENIPMGDARYVEVSFTSKDSPTVSGRYPVILSKKVSVPGQEVTLHAVHFAAPEFVNNARHKVCKAFENIKGSDIIKSILTETLGFKEGEGKTLSIDPSLYDETQVFPGAEPIFAIASMLRRMLDPNNPEAANFFFWGDRDGYNLKSFETLVKKEIAATLFFQVQIQDRRDTYNPMIVKALTFPPTTNMITGVGAGVYKAQSSYFDLLNKKVIKTDLNIEKWLPATATLNKNQAWRKQADEDNERPQTDGLVRSAVFDPTGPNKKMDEFSLRRTAQVANIVSGLAHVMIDGTTDLKVGDVIYLFHSSEASSGKYVISAIRHMLTTGKYDMSMELVRDSIPTAAIPQT